MKEYTIKWSDGNAAASRGGDCDHVEMSYIKAKDDKEAIKKAYIFRAMSNWGTSIPDDDTTIEDAKKEFLEDFGYDNEKDLRENGDESDIEEYDCLSKDDEDWESKLDDINMDNIDGGWPWIIWVKDSKGNMIYDNSDCDIYDPDEIDERIEELPKEFTVPKDYVEEYLDGGKIEDEEKYDIMSEILTPYAEDELELDLDIYDFDDLIGKIEVSNYKKVQKLPNGDYKFTGIEWESNTDF